MGHDHHDNHHHVDDLSGFSLFRVIWPAALLVLLVFVTRNCFSSGCCAGDTCGKEGKCEGHKTEVHKDHGAGHGEEKHGH